MANIDLIRELLDRSADGAYIIDQEQRISAWNKAAESILGFTAQEVVGANCFQVLGGHLDGGCMVCRRGCLPHTAGLRGELVPNFDAQVRTAGGLPRWINVTVIALPAANGNSEPDTVIHFFRDIEAKKRAETFTKDVVGWVRQLRLQGPEPFAANPLPIDTGLTERECQVLRLLCQGADTDNIASQLVIDKSTVRNHIQRILHKLGVHSRLEAVTYAREHGLIEP
ncbi:MAG: PAS domain S-box protein [Anaerolineales bacterium]|nr:PAS domain S-box protein [Anaerolineales bacterium]